MKKIITLFIGILSSIQCFSQVPVWDIGAVETLIANHKVQHASFKKVKENEGIISGLQKKISKKMTQVEYFQTKLHNSLKSANTIINASKDIVYARKIVKEIYKYQKRMFNIASSDPKLLVVAYQTEYALVDRTSSLMQYIYQVVVVGTDVNLMDNKQRLDLLKYVIKELRTMRGLAFSVCRQMRTAQRSGILHSISPGLFPKNPDAKKKLIDDIINDRYL